MMDEPFIVRALLAGVGVAFATGMLGCFVVWKKMAYFGDSLAHASLAGIPLGLIAGMGTKSGIFVIVSVFALLLAWINGRGRIATDTVLGIVAHASLALGIVAVSLTGLPVLNLHSVLFGDILAVGTNDVFIIYICSAAVFVLLLFNWDSLILMTVSEDLAKAEGVNTFRLNFLLMFLMAAVVAVSFQVVGVLLVTSMLIIPAASARVAARSPEIMALTACLAGAGSVFFGIYCSLLYDTPSGPSIVTVSALFFIVCLAGSNLSGRIFRCNAYSNEQGGKNFD